MLVASYQQIPIEICEHIIDQIPEVYFMEDRPPVLLACALVSRLWVPRCRVHLFKNIELTSVNTQPFIKTLIEYPYLGENVQYLIISGFTKSEVHSWIYDILYNLPKVLSKVCALTLHALPVLHQASVPLLGQFSSITILTLDNLHKFSFAEITRLINRFTNLQALNVESCGWKSSSHVYRGKSHKLVSLDILCTPSMNNDVSSWIIASKSGKDLKYLTIQLCPQSHNIFNTLCAECPKTLQEVVTYYSDDKKTCE